MVILGLCSHLCAIYFINVSLFRFTCIHYLPYLFAYSLLIVYYNNELAVLAQMVACLPLVQQVQGSIPGGVVNFNLKIFNLGARRGEDVHFLIARLYITILD